MSINQAAIHYNLPYSSLYGRFKRGKYDIVGAAAVVTNNADTSHVDHSPENTVSENCMIFSHFFLLSLILFSLFLCNPDAIYSRITTNTYTNK
jgi:hypothetical protein